MSPSKPTHKGRWVTCEKQDNTHQALSEFHRTLKGRRREKPRLSQNKRGGEKKKKRKAGMDEGRGDFKAPFFPPLAADADCCSPLRFLTCGALPLSVSGSFSLSSCCCFKTRGGEWALQCSPSLAAPSPPFLLPPSPAHPVQSMPYFLCCLWNGTHSLLSSVCFLSLRMNEFKGTPTLDSDLGMMMICSLSCSAVSPPLSNSS